MSESSAARPVAGRKPQHNSSTVTAGRFPLTAIDSNAGIPRAPFPAPSFAPPAYFWVAVPAAIYTRIPGQPIPAAFHLHRASPDTADARAALIESVDWSWINPSTSDARLALRRTVARMRSQPPTRSPPSDNLPNEPVAAMVERMTMEMLIAHAQVDADLDVGVEVSSLSHQERILWQAAFNDHANDPAGSTDWVHETAAHIATAAEVIQSGEYYKFFDAIVCTPQPDGTVVGSHLDPSLAFLLPPPKPKTWITGVPQHWDERKYDSAEELAAKYTRPIVAQTHGDALEFAAMDAYRGTVDPILPGKRTHDDDQLPEEARKRLRLWIADGDDELLFQPEIQASASLGLVDAPPLQGLPNETLYMVSPAYDYDCFDDELSFTRQS